MGLVLGLGWWWDCGWDEDEEWDGDGVGGCN